MEPDKPRPRGRPKDGALERRLLDAAIDTLVEHGFSGLTIERITERAGAPRSAFYRRWPSAKAAVVAALSQVYGDAYPPPPDTGDVTRDLAALAEAMGGLLRDPRYGVVMRFLIAETAVDETLREPTMALVRRRREAAGTVLRRGIARGQLAAHTDIDLIIETVSGALLFHHVFGETDADAGYAARVSALALAGGLRDISTTADASTPSALASSSGA